MPCIHLFIPIRFCQFLRPEENYSNSMMQQQAYWTQEVIYIQNNMKRVLSATCGWTNSFTCSPESLSSGLHTHPSSNPARSASERRSRVLERALYPQSAGSHLEDCGVLFKYNTTTDMIQMWLQMTSQLIHSHESSRSVALSGTFGHEPAHI